MGIFNAIQRVSDDEGADYLKTYYLAESGFYTGSEFERIGAELGVENSFTGADLYSVETLAVRVPARAGIAILGEESSAFNGVLEQIPTVAIGSLSESEFEKHLGLESKAIELWICSGAIGRATEGGDSDQRPPVKSWHGSVLTSSQSKTPW